MYFGGPPADVPADTERYREGKYHGHKHQRDRRACLTLEQFPGDTVLCYRKGKHLNQWPTKGL